MQMLISSFSKYVQHVYRKAEGFIEDEREFPLSEAFLNATFQRFVTDNVKMLKDLHADLHDDWLRLYATLNYNGLNITLSVDLKLLQMEMTNKVQLVVFEQISNTSIVKAQYPNILHKWGVHLAVFYYQKILNKDPLGKVLEKLNVLTVKDDLLYLDLNRWMGKSESIIDTLAKVHINHAALKESELIVFGNVNLIPLLSLFSKDPIDPESTDFVTESKNIN